MFRAGEWSPREESDALILEGTASAKHWDEGTVSEFHLPCPRSFIPGEDPVSAAVRPIRKQLGRWNTWQPGLSGNHLGSAAGFPFPTALPPPPLVLSPHLVKNPGSGSGMASKYFCFKSSHELVPCWKDAVKKKGGGGHGQRRDSFF